MFEKFFDALASVLNFFYLLVPEGLRDSLGFGLAIMGLTVLVMILITPLTVKSTKSMLQMQRLQPEMKRLQEKYKNDREKLNTELMAFYRENQINPLGGCLPMLAQAPVFFIMYRLIYGLTQRKGGLGSGVGQTLSNLHEGNPFEPWRFTDQVFHPSHLDQSTELYKSLSSVSKMNFLGMDLSLSAADAIRLGIIIAIPFLVLLGIMLATGLYQNHQLQSRNTSANSNPQQQMIMKFMPFFLPIISFGFPAGMALYWCTQNLCRIGTNAYITKSVYRHEHQGEIETTASEKKSGPKASGGSKAAKKSVGSGGGAKASGAKPGSKKTKDKETVSKDPGSSVKSQAAHKNAQLRSSGGDKRGAAASNGKKSAKSGSSGVKVNPRRSGEARRKQR